VDAEAEAWAGVEDTEGDEAEEGEEGGNSYAQAQSPTPATPSDRSLQLAGRPTSAYLLLGVIVTIAHEGHTHRESASDGQITLGVTTAPAPRTKPAQHRCRCRCRRRTARSGASAVPASGL
jgi:hypothetical protein